MPLYIYFIHRGVQRGACAKQRDDSAAASMIVAALTKCRSK